MMDVCFLVRLVLSPLFLGGAALAYLILKVTFKWRGIQLLTESIPCPPQFPYFGHLEIFNNIKSFADVSHYIYRAFDKYGPIFKLWMAHELWVCVSHQKLAKEISEFWGSYICVPSYNFLGFAKEPSYRKKFCSFHTKLYEPNSSATVHQDRVEKATRDLLTELKSKANRGYVNSTELRLAIQACVMRFIRDIDWEIDIRSEYKNKIYIPFQDRFDMFLLNFKNLFGKIMLKYVYTTMKLGENPKFSDDFLKPTDMVFEHHEKVIPSPECRITVNELNLNVVDGSLNHLSGEVSEHVAAQLSKVAEIVGVFLVNLLQDVASHPDVLQKLREEVETLNGPYSPVPNIDMERKLYYSEMVIKEGLRLYSPPGVFYRTGKDFKIDDKVVPKGCVAFISAQHLHMNHEFYERPTSFYPEHFSFERMRQAPNGIYFPLYLEVPYCTDARLILKLMKIILSTLGGNFTLETNVTPESIKHDFFKLNENLKTINFKTLPL